MFTMAQAQEVIAKFIHTADWHVGMENYSRVDPQTGLSTRLGYFLRSIDFVVDYAIKEKVDFFLFAGDAFKTREPTPTHQREFAKRILKLSRLNIPCVLLVGNHDTPNAFGKANSLDIYSALEIENVHVIREPQLITIKNVQILGIPWVSRKEFGEIDTLIEPLYNQVKPNLPLVVTAPASVEGAVFGSERTVSLGGDMVISKPSLAKHPQTAYVALGHIHKRQVVQVHPPIVYSGSIERVDFGEENETKSFEIVEILKQVQDDKITYSATHTPIPTPARRFLTIKTTISGSDPDPTATILSEIKKQDFKDAVVKLIVDFPPNSTGDIKTTEIKKSLEDAFIIAGINKNIEKVARNQLGDGVNAETLSAEDLLEKYFQSKGFSESRISKLKQLAKTLAEE